MPPFSNVYLFDPRLELLPRDDNGCVTDCPTLGECPVCPSGQECVQTQQTCESCAQYKCQELLTPPKSSVPIGGIVGGAIGGFVFLAVLTAIVYYFMIYKKKPRVELDSIEEDLTSDELISMTKKSASDVISPTSGSFKFNQNETGVQVTTIKKTSKRSSVYDTFTKPGAIKSKSKRSTQADQRRLRQEQIIQQANRQLRQAQGNASYSESNRNSVATSISTTNASNILPIAYIPGVTVRPTKNNTRSVYSYETESVFSDLNTIENASIIGDVAVANRVSEQKSNDAPGTMTAIKAQPRLVNVDRIDEDDEEDDLEYDEDDVLIVEKSEKIVTRAPPTSSITPTNKEMIIKPSQDSESDDEDDSDVDSDIGEITRATSVKRETPVLRQLKPQLENHKQKIINRPPEPPMAEIPLELIDSKDDTNTGSGSFVLDVEFDIQDPKLMGLDLRETTRSPFADP